MPIVLAVSERKQTMFDSVCVEDSVTVLLLLASIVSGLNRKPLQSGAVGTELHRDRPALWSLRYANDSLH
ncbi:hypothetical protein COCON_G00158250 [Conger conger]|uniref:Uncharacterized protein n=1 Tax=Conger conger TaxID=82655 RepID=A0A9Q1D9L7_CONCO|nr:hypothetical protein COCON_G00158250 [Conger conger]